MALKLIHGPPNSGRAGRIRRALTAVLDRDPILVVPTVDDVYSFERELCAGGAVLGAEVTTFDGLFRTVAVAGGSSPRPELSPAQRLGAVGAAIAARRPKLRPLRGSAAQPGFPAALERLFDELQGAGLEPADVEAATETLEGSAYLGDLASLFAGYALVRDRLGFTDRHGVAREAIDLLSAENVIWWPRPLFIYGFDDLTRNQLDLIGGLASAAEVTVALPYEEGNAVLEDRAAPLLESLEEIGIDSIEKLEADPGNTPDAPLLYHLERGFGAAEPGRMLPDDGLVHLRSAGERGEAETIAAEVARLLADGAEPEEIAIVVRDPSRRGPLLASVLESYGIPTALEAEVPVGTTSVGGSLIALLEALLGTGRATDLLRYLRGPAGAPAERVDWFERGIRRDRILTAGAALSLWEERFGDLPADVTRVREAAAQPGALAAAIGEMAVAIGVRADSDLEAKAAGAISTAITERAELDGLAPPPGSLAQALTAIAVRVWSGPVGERVRIADPRRVRAARFDNVFVGSLQEGEFPRGAGGVDPFLSESHRKSLGLQPRRDAEAEERYLFHACLALPRKRLFLSYRNSDEDGAAEAPSPFLDDIRRLLEPMPGVESPDPIEDRIRGRDLAQVVHRIADAPSETELARSIAAEGMSADATALAASAVAGTDTGGEVAGRVLERIRSAREVEAATRAPGPLREPAVIESLAAVPAYGGTTLEEFDLCSYRWFVGHELDPQPLDPAPDALVQGGVMHATLDRLYSERPGGDALPRQASLPLWKERGRELIAQIAAERAIGRRHPAERALIRRVERLLDRFLIEESRRETDGFEPWLLEAAFGEQEESDRPPLRVDDWALHGAIDRVDRDRAGNALVLDYKVASSVAPRDKFEEKAKLQLQLYLLAVAEHWGAPVVGGLYHPMRGTSVRRPRGVVLSDVAESLASYRLYENDIVGEEELTELLEEARRRAGAIVARMRRGEIRRDPGPRRGLRGHGICPTFCDFAPICRRDRAPVAEEDFEGEER
jgi:ATP-dependent helicase/DNAse subunit B